MKKTIITKVLHLFLLVTLSTKSESLTLTNILNQGIQTVPLKLSPTQAHLLYFAKDNKKNLWYKFITSPSIINTYYLLFKNAYKNLHRLLQNHTINQVIDKAFNYEVERAKTDCFFAYHATQSSFYAIHYIDTALRRLEQKLFCNNIIPKTIIKLRQPLKEKDNLAQHKPAYLERQSKKRHRYVKHGIILGDDAQKHHRKYLLSCNWALTGNMLRPSSSTISYFAQNFNKYCPSFNYDCICEQYIISHNAKKSIPQLQQSVAHFVQQTNHGILLQLLFKDKNLFRDTTYLSAPGGQKYQPENLKRKIFGSIESPDVFLNKITQKNISLPYQFAPLDYQQLRVILTHDKLLDVANPEIYNNFEVHAYSTNQQALDEFHHEVDAIMAQIKADYLIAKR